MKTDDNQVHRITKYYLLTAENLHDISSLYLDTIFDDICAIGNNPVNMQEANKLMLRAIFAYDKSKKKRNDLLEFALRIIQWSDKQSNDEKCERLTNELNVMQITKRNRPLNQGEFERLHEVVEQCAGNHSLLTGAYILLGNFSSASRHYEQLSEKERETFMKFPIMNLWTQESEIRSD